MIIRELYNKVLNEMDSDGAANNIGGSGADAVAMLDPILKKQSKLSKIGTIIRRLRRPIDPTVASTQGQTGPQHLAHTPIVDNGLKNKHKSPLDLLKKSSIAKTLKRAVKKSDLRSRVYK